TIKRSQEGDNGRVKLEAWADVRPDTGYRRRLWSTVVDGNAARLLENYYEITEAGCCGARDTRTYLSLDTGRPVVSFTDGPVALRGGDVGESNTQEPLAVVYLSSEGVVPSRAL